MQSLAQYSLIGNCRSAALVSVHGSIDWCCLPEYHSPAVFSALLDRKRGGFFCIAPTVAYQSSQEYIPDTNILETFFTTESGTVKVTDAFIVMQEEDKSRSLFPDHEILRIVTATSGTVPMKMEFHPSLYYGKFPATLQDRQTLGITFSWKENMYLLLSTLEEGKTLVLDNRAVAEFEIRHGQTLVFSFSSSSQGPAILPELRSTGLARMRKSMDYWKSWISGCTYKGIYEDQVRRSALVLKLLAHAPSGAIIAAPTTSLPEEIGGERNWDYRYCWLRDASFTVRVLLKLGFESEAHAYMDWILHATQLTRPKLQVVYSVFGDARLPESNLHWLDGYKSSRPVRIGNGAYGQHQLDVYGEVLDAFYSYSRIVDEFDKPTKKFLLGLGKAICKMWEKPDHGIWEMRSAPAHYTHSKVMAWVGLDRLVKISEKYKWQDQVEGFRKTAQSICHEIESRGYNPQLGAYTMDLDGETLDASTLVFSLVDYCDAHSPRMVSTVKAVCDQLSRDNLIYRYRSGDGLKGGEGCFGICNFWLAENFARMGKLEDAKRIFESVLDHSSPTGLLSEEMDPGSHEMLGNYPQGFTHIGFIHAALSLNEAIQKGGRV